MAENNVLMKQKCKKRRLMSELKKLEAGEGITGGLSLIRAASKWMYLCGIFKKSKHSLILSFAHKRQLSHADPCDMMAEYLRTCNAKSNPQYYNKALEKFEQFEKQLAQYRESGNDRDTVYLNKDIEIIALHYMVNLQKETIYKLESDLKHDEKVFETIKEKYLTANIKEICKQVIEQENSIRETSSQTDELRNSMGKAVKDLDHIIERVQFLLHLLEIDFADHKLGVDAKVYKNNIIEALAAVEAEVNRLLNARYYMTCFLPKVYARNTAERSSDVFKFPPPSNIDILPKLDSDMLPDEAEMPDFIEDTRGISISESAKVLTPSELRAMAHLKSKDRRSSSIVGPVKTKPSASLQALPNLDEHFHPKKWYDLSTSKLRNMSSIPLTLCESPTRKDRKSP